MNDICDVLDHSESYNPPDEYLMSDAEKRKWEEADPEEREKNYLPQKFACLRRVPLYGNFVKERYDRCLDLYLCPRSLKRKMNIDRSVLLPQLPNISELRPFPTTQSMNLSQIVCVQFKSMLVDTTWLLEEMPRSVGEKGRGKI